MFPETLDPKKTSYNFVFRPTIFDKASLKKTVKKTVQCNKCGQPYRLSSGTEPTFFIFFIATGRFPIKRKVHLLIAIRDSTQYTKICKSTLSNIHKIHFTTEYTFFEFSNTIL